MQPELAARPWPSARSLNLPVHEVLQRFLASRHRLRLQSIIHHQRVQGFQRVLTVHNGTAKSAVPACVPLRDRVRERAAL